ncbi:MAG TPA: hypothetical protein VFZ48_01325 [Candidatus Saccharimonadales bacterium]
MIYIVALNGVNKRKLNEALNHVRAEVHFEVLYCKDLQALGRLPKRDYYYFVIGRSGAISPEQLAGWLGARVSLRKPENGPIVLFQGEVARQDDYRQVVLGHFGMPRSAPKMIIINSPGKVSLDIVLPLYSGAETLVCPSFAALKRLPNGFYENILIGGGGTITAQELAAWMDVAIPKHLQYQVNIILVDNADLAFMGLPRRHTPRER